MAYRFIQKYNILFGTRWLLRRLNILPNAYYNFLKNRKANYYAKKEKALNEIKKIYHKDNGVDGYRSIRVFLTDGSKRYNCSILDLHDRSIVASITDKHITSDLAIRTVQKALASQPSVSESLILHSDQGSQYTSKDFTEFCQSVGITQSMSKAGYPYDNAPMERYYNTLKNELIYLHYYHNDEELNKAVEEFAYVRYNHVRPHSYNNYKTPYEARHGIKKY